MDYIILVVVFLVMMSHFTLVGGWVKVSNLTNHVIVVNCSVEASPYREVQCVVSEAYNEHS